MALPEIKIQIFWFKNAWWSRVEILGHEDGSCRITSSPSQTPKESLLKALEIIQRYAPLDFDQ
jgi:hypothetical protein